MDKTTLQRMKLLRDYRYNRIIDKDLKNINVKYLGETNISRVIDDKEKNRLEAIYLVIEMFEKDGITQKLEKYFSVDSETGELTELTNEDLGNLKDFEMEDNLDLNTIEELERQGIDFDDILSASEYDLEEFRKQGIDLEKADKEENEEEKEQEENEKDKDELEFSEEETKKITDGVGKQEINLKTKTDTKRTVADELGVSAEEYTSLYVVYSKDVKELTNSQQIGEGRYTFILKGNDGRAKTLDLHRNTTKKQSVKINLDETAEENKVTSDVYDLPGNKRISVNNKGPYGTPRVYVGGNTKEEGENIGFEIPAKNSYKYRTHDMNKLSRETITGGVYKNDKIKEELRTHEGEEVDQIAMYDGDENSVILSDYIDHKWDEIVEEMLKDDRIIDVGATKKDIEGYLESWKNSKDGEKEYTIENIKEIKIEDKIKEIEADLEMYQGPEKQHQ